MRKINYVKIILILGDVCLMYLALFWALLIRDKSLILDFPHFFYRFLVLYALWVFVIFVLALYDLHFLKKVRDFFFGITVFSGVAFFIAVTYFYFRPTSWITPKTILLLNVLIFDGLFLCWRYVVNFFLQARGVKEKVVIVGFYKRLPEIFSQLKKIYAIEAVFCPPGTSEQDKCLVPPSNIGTLSKISDLKNTVLEKKITSIIFSLDFYSSSDLVKEIFNALPLTINYMGMDDVYELIVKKVSLDRLNETWFLEEISRPEDMFAKSIKRIFDIVFSVVGLCCFVVILPFVAIAIKLDSEGNVFYSQKRPGKNGTIFTLRKFRTMKQFKGDGETAWREKDASSVTRVGKFLRRTHLDELPQALSILKGDLSFVGPRPEPMKLATLFETEIPFYKQRYLVKPGIIGWAQINFPASKSIDEAKEKFEYDLYYIKNRSLLLDIEIILKAVKLFLW